jgi:hypothetical protein
MTRPLAALALLFAACAHSPRPASRPAPATAVLADAPRPAAPLDRSLFAPRGGSGLTEADLARILDAPLALKFPARVGVVALGLAFTPMAPAALDAGLVATRALTDALEGNSAVAVATEVSSQLPTGGGVEGLRELAARYRLNYLLLYSERFEDRSHGNGWGALWITGVGGLLAPSVTVEGVGALQASLLDVRTGTVLFSIQEPIAFSERSLPLGAKSAWDRLSRQSADRAAAALSQRVIEKLGRLARSAEAGEGAAARVEGELRLVN